MERWERQAGAEAKWMLTKKPQTTPEGGPSTEWGEMHCFYLGLLKMSLLYGNLLKSYTSKLAPLSQKWFSDSFKQKYKNK